MATRDWTRIDKFTDYLTAAGTISSLILGILAIIYSFISSRQQSDLMGSIGSSSKDIQIVAGQLSVVAASAESIQKKADLRTDTMLELVEQLKSSLGSLQESTTNIDSKSADIASRVQTVQSQIEAMAKPSLLEPLAAKESHWNDTTLQAAIATASLTGLCALNVLAIASEAENKKFDLTKYSQHGGPKDPSYMQGYLVALDAASMFDLEFQKSPERHIIYKVREFPEKLSGWIKKEFETRINAAKPDQKVRWQAFVDSAPLCIE